MEDEEKKTDEEAVGTDTAEQECEAETVDFTSRIKDLEDMLEKSAAESEKNLARARDLNTRIEERKNKIPAAPVKTPQAETPSADATKMIKFSLDDDDDDPLTRKFDD